MMGYLGCACSENKVNLTATNIAPRSRTFGALQIQPPGVFASQVKKLEAARIAGKLAGLMPQTAFGGFGRLGFTLPQQLTSTGMKAGVVGAVGSAITSRSESKFINDTVYGATIGSVIPVVGTVVGAAIGAVVGIIQTVFGNKNVRPSSQDKAACQTFVNQYMTAAQQAGDLPIGQQVGDDGLRQLQWCFQALKGGYIGSLDPRFFDGGYQSLKQIATDIVMKVFNTPVGGTITTSGTSTSVGRQTFTSAAQSFPNPPITTLAQLRDLVVAVNTAACQQAVRAPQNQGCGPFDQDPIFQRLVYDLCGLLVMTLLPTVNKDSATNPNAPAPAAALPAPAPTAAPPPMVSPTIAAAPVVASTPVSPSTPVVTTPTSQASTSTPGVDINALAAQLVAQGQSQQQAFASMMAQMQAQGVPPTPQVQQQVAQAVDTATAPKVATAGGIFGLPGWVVGGALGIAALLFMTARPAPGHAKH